MYVKVFRNSQYNPASEIDWKYKCVVCDEHFSAWELNAYVCDDTDRSIGKICPDCISIGTEGIHSRLLERVESLRRLISEKELIAAHSIVVPTHSECFAVMLGDTSNYSSWTTQALLKLSNDILLDVLTEAEEDDRPRLDETDLTDEDRRNFRLRYCQIDAIKEEIRSRTNEGAN